MLKLTLDNLSVARHGTRILRGISATLSAGTLTSVIGRNGSGKTTLLKAIAGLLPAEGTVRLEDAGESLTQAAIAYVPQLSSVETRLTVTELVLLGLVRELGWRVSDEIRARVADTLAMLGIEHLATRTLNTLSGGQKQLVFMAQAFVSRPRLLLLDEPTSALDLKHQLIVMNAARRYTEETGAIMIAVVHDLLLASRVSDQLLLLDAGGVRATGPVAEVLTPTLLQAAFGVSVSVEPTRAGCLAVVPLAPL